MTVLGLGVDIVLVARIARSLDEHGERFLSRVYTQRERCYADKRPRRRAEHLAARFAAKEAALKALGTGWRSGIAWTDVEVVNDAGGAPTLRVTGEAARIADGKGVANWLVSLSHTTEQAIATVLALEGGLNAS